jgi:hypothetical protein
VTLLTTPARVGPAAIEVRLESDGQPGHGASVRVVGDMTHAGMVPVVAAPSTSAAAVYRTEGFAFDMVGDWVITAEVRYPDAVTRQGSWRCRSPADATAGAASVRGNVRISGRGRWTPRPQRSSRLAYR